MTTSAIVRKSPSPATSADAPATDAIGLDGVTGALVTDKLSMVVVRLLSIAIEVV